MSEAEHPSKTPILDLEQPLPLPPPPSKGSRLAGNIVGFLMVVIAVGLRTPIPFLVVLAYFVISLIAVGIHEFGHLLAGRSVGMRLSYLAIGPVKFMRQSGRWTMYRRSSPVGGLILMSLDKVRRVRRRLLVWVIGGPAASLITGAAALVACRAERVGGDPRIGLPVAGFAILSLLAGIQSLRNGRSGGYSTDGVLLRTLWSSYEGAKQQIAAHALQIQESKGWEDPLWKRRWMRLASASSKVHPTSFHSDLLQFQLSTDADLAAEYLERCLAGLAWLAPDQREESMDLLCLEASSFMARYRNDAERAQTWFGRAPHPERALPLLRRKVQIALHYASGEFDQAIAELDLGLDSLEQLQAGLSGEVLAASWMEWRSVIQAKRDEVVPIPQ